MTSHPWQIKCYQSTPLDYEQCGARMWAWLSGAHWRSPNKLPSNLYFTQPLITFCSVDNLLVILNISKECHHATSRGWEKHLFLCQTIGQRLACWGVTFKYEWMDSEGSRSWKQQLLPVVEITSDTRQFPVNYCTCTVKVHGIRLQCPGKDEHESQRLTSPLRAAHPRRNVR